MDRCDVPFAFMLVSNSIGYVLKMSEKNDDNSNMNIKIKNNIKIVSL